MTTKVIQADRERLRSMLASASERPWRIEQYGDGDSLVIHDARQDWRVCFMATPGESSGSIRKIEANADLIVAAINALPALLDDLDILASHADPLRRALEQAFDFLGGVDDAAEIRSVILAALSSGENNNGE